MFDVTGFFLRWLYLCNLVRDVAEIQVLPFTPQLHKTPPPPPGGNPVNGQNQGSTDHWKEEYLRGIMSYPPGTQRLYAIDTLRYELVQKLNRHLSETDAIVKKYTKFYRRLEQERETSNGGDESDDDDPYLDADVEILRVLEEATNRSEDEDEESADSSAKEEEALLVISNNGTSVNSVEEGELKAEIKAASTTVGGEHSEDELPSQFELEYAHKSLNTFRDYLPQLVSAVLKSPGALQPQLLDPIQKLRSLLLRRCVKEANWGIELCWLLEAEVGRAWKTLFEHRQQTGKRLIIVLPAEKAAVIAKIGASKREAFDLLQDVEQATAYGYTIPPHPSQQKSGDLLDTDVEQMPARLPSSLSLRRCSHFGDTMHFIDRLTQISLDLRRIPIIQRKAYLQEQLEEMNRRLRRRMVTRGDVSLDVEDGSGAYDWPRMQDISVDLLKYSVHFPLEPMVVTWPGGDKDTRPERCIAERTRAGVMRVLNILAPESRLLSSRERCPYLVHLEVAETGLEGSDARLYASGTKGLGATVEESLSIPVSSRAKEEIPTDNAPAYKIPSELIRTIPTTRKIVGRTEKTLYPSRGGWQSDDGLFYQPHSSDYDFPNQYEQVRQQQLEQLHNQMQQQSRPQTVSEDIERPNLSRGIALLDRVFGLPWKQRCDQVRQTSPYGKVKGWRLASFIMKAGEDIRREALVMQVINMLNEWFKTDIDESMRPKMRPYTIMCVGGDAGLLECLSDAKSVDEIKKKTDGYSSLRNFFERAYGKPKQMQRQHNPMGPIHGHVPEAPGQTENEITFEQAQDNFLRSLVGYSLLCYILQIKDRHNANIMMDREGHVMHIDFGYVLGDTPKMAKVPIFSERAPFKLSADFWDLLGGWDWSRGGLGVKFCQMFEVAFACAAAHAEDIATTVEAALLNLTRNARVARNLANGIRTRLTMRGPPGSNEHKAFIMELVNTSLKSWGTSTYDWLQHQMNGYV